MGKSGGAGAWPQNKKLPDEIYPGEYSAPHVSLREEWLQVQPPKFGPSQRFSRRGKCSVSLGPAELPLRRGEAEP